MPNSPGHRAALPAALLLTAVATTVLLGSCAQKVKAQGASRQTAGAQTSAEFQSLSKQAQAALDADKLQEAVPLFRRALKLNPRWAEGWWSLGTAYYDQDSYAEAELAFQRVIALEPKNGTAHAMLGLCEFELGDDKGALHDIEATKALGIDLDPQLRNVVLFHEGVLLTRAGMFVAAEKPLASMCRDNLGGADVARAFGMAALHMTDRQPPAPGSEAATVVQQVGHADCIAAQKDFDTARRQFTYVVTTYPHFPYVHFAFGRMLIEASDIPGAVSEFKREIDEGHDRLLPMLQIAAAEYKLDSAAGLPYAQQAVALAPQVPFGHYLLGLLLANTGDDTKAIPELETARKAFPKDLKIYWALAAAYAHAGRSEDAMKARAEIARLTQAAGQQEAGAGLDAPITVTDAADQSRKN